VLDGNKKAATWFTEALVKRGIEFAGRQTEDDEQDVWPLRDEHERTNDMNDKNDLLLTEAMDLISRAKGMIVLLHAEERRGEAWTLPLEAAIEHLADAHKQLEELSVNDPKPHATAS
jgi:hypothetical protein